MRGLTSTMQGLQCAGCSGHGRRQGRLPPPGPDGKNGRPAAMKVSRCSAAVVTGRCPLQDTPTRRYLNDMTAAAPETFESALRARAQAMADACTRCGKCVEACPTTEAAGLTPEERANPVEVISGIVDLVRQGQESNSRANDAARKWASGCLLSGECIKACDYGVNPRFLLYMARIAMAHAKDAPAEQRRAGVNGFRLVARDVSHLSQIQLDDALLARLGQGPNRPARDPNAKPDFVFYTGCNVLKTPHIALLALDIMDALGVTYRVMGGPSHCCSIVHFRTGDLQTSGNFAENTLGKLASAKNGQVLAWCASCHVQFTEVNLPAHERMTGSRPFEMVPFMRYLRSRLDDLRALMRKSVDMRIALHRHPGVPGVMEAGEDILRAIPGIEIVDLHQPAVGLMSNYLRSVPEYKRKLQLDELKIGRAH